MRRTATINSSINVDQNIPEATEAPKVVYRRGDGDRCSRHLLLALGQAASSHAIWLCNIADNLYIVYMTGHSIDQQLSS